MLDGEDEIVAVAAQVEVRVAPGVEFGRAAQRLAGACLAGALAGVVDEHDGDGEPALQLAQVREQRRDLARHVLVDAVQADERIEDEQPWPQVLDGVRETLAIFDEVEAEGRRGDDLDVERGEGGAGAEGDAFEAPPDDVQGVLGREEQDAARLDGREAPEARRSRRHGDGHVEREEGLAALGLTPDDADRLGGPQPIDQPAPIFGDGG